MTLTGVSLPDHEPDTRFALEVRNLVTTISTKSGTARAVDSISFAIRPGETLALVGESGSGKSMTALSVIGLHPAPAAQIASGNVLINGRSVVGLSPKEWAQVRGAEVGMILQDPLAALNPVFSIRRQVGEGPRIHDHLRGVSLDARVLELLNAVKIPRAEERLDDFPHQFSGGMRQRVVGAISIACNPGLLIADEPTTGLDVTVERTFLQLLKRLQRETGVAILFITHDFGIVRSFADRVAVMYSGRIVETGPTEQVLREPKHPYTVGLIASVPDLLSEPPARLPSIAGSPPSLFAAKPGCHFAPRCPHVMDVCKTEIPPDVVSEDGSRSVLCWLYA